MNPKEATRLLRKCIPAMRQSGEPLPEELENNLRPSDVKVKSLCRLWAGMGHIYDVSLLGGQHHVIVKRVSPQPRSQLRSIGDRRKADSYQVEASFYDSFAPRLINDHNLSIPRPYHVERGGEDGQQVTICMSRVEGRELHGTEAARATMSWLATLHAATWGEENADAMVSGGLQAVGSYWHLDTRPEEHENMSRKGWEGRLYRAARAISDRLKRDDMQCIIHGDAKDANMLWKKCGNDDRIEVSMYDFQYCGKAPPTVDLAYFLCVAADNDKEALLEFYHQELVLKLESSSNIDPPTLSDLKESLSLAYCDFARFMCGWGWWGDDLSSEVIEVLDRLDGGKDLGSEEAYDAAIRQEFG